MNSFILYISLLFAITPQPVPDRDNHPEYLSTINQICSHMKQKKQDETSNLLFLIIIILHTSSYF